MTPAQYEKSIQTGYLQLTNWQKFNHFSIVGFFLFIPLFYLGIIFYKHLNDNLINISTDEFYLMLLPTILAGLFYWLQKSRLKFKMLKSDLNKKTLDGYLEALCKEWNWTIKKEYCSRIFSEN
jgi:hypothetical protein